ncbi:hypothetical protein BH11BAC7_BH11BAC7_31880 [soil metagenome]
MNSAKKLNKISLLLLIISLVLVASIYVFEFPYDTIPAYMACILGFSFGLFLGLNITFILTKGGVHGNVPGVSPGDKAVKKPSEIIS